eukprot:TRINITY_DN11897_c0_g1_i2.p1 TRINITY_DN11897_c0_g1~~TRINITY_DN11897_c0_g1_i2.p1  ORF type:complete len:718 (-),score=164.30 TRINITY_DN11897_c0_g1_i2:131-2284(-)
MMEAQSAKEFNDALVGWRVERDPAVIVETKGLFSGQPDLEPSPSAQPEVAGDTEAQEESPAGTTKLPVPFSRIAIPKLNLPDLPPVESQAPAAKITPRLARFLERTANTRHSPKKDGVFTPRSGSISWSPSTSMEYSRSQGPSHSPVPPQAAEHCTAPEQQQAGSGDLSPADQPKESVVKDTESPNEAATGEQPEQDPVADQEPNTAIPKINLPTDRDPVEIATDPEVHVAEGSAEQEPVESSAEEEAWAAEQAAAEKAAEQQAEKAAEQQAQKAAAAKKAAVRKAMQDLENTPTKEAPDSSIQEEPARGSTPPMLARPLPPTAVIGSSFADRVAAGRQRFLPEGAPLEFPRPIAASLARRINQESSPVQNVLTTSPQMSVPPPLPVPLSARGSPSAALRALEVDPRLYASNRLGLHAPAHHGQPPKWRIGSRLPRLSTEEQQGCLRWHPEHPVMIDMLELFEAIRSKIQKLVLNGSTDYKLVGVEKSSAPDQLREWAHDVVRGIDPSIKTELELSHAPVISQSAWCEGFDCQAAASQEPHRAEVFRWAGFRAASTSPITSPMDEDWQIAPGFFIVSHEVWLVIPPQMPAVDIKGMVARLTRLICAEPLKLARELALYHSGGGLAGAELCFATVCSESSGGCKFAKCRSIQQMLLSHTEEGLEEPQLRWIDFTPPPTVATPSRAELLASMSRSPSRNMKSPSPGGMSPMSERRFGIL